jgi:hypothetical protein
MAEAVRTMVKLKTPPGVLFHKRLRDLIASGVNPHIDIGDGEAWKLWERWARDEICRIRHNTQAERRAFLGDKWRRKESMFYMSAGNKRFNERYLNPQPKHVLDSVLRADGRRDYDPKTYMPEIDKRAGKVFSNKRELPKQRAVNHARESAETRLSLG